MNKTHAAGGTYWLQLALPAEPEQAEQLAEALQAVGALSVSLADGGADALFETAPGPTALWLHTRVVGLFPGDCDVATILVQVQQTLGLTNPPVYHLEHLQNQDWARAWRTHFQPRCYGPKLWVCPHGETPPDPNAVNLFLDPGLAFGTGSHPTTALCLEWLEQADIGEKTVIDYGCGSGILGIAAVKLGAHQAWAVDIDPQALESTRSNATANGVADRVNTRLADTALPPGHTADVLLANILANPLIELAGHFAVLLPAGGRLVLSGILAEQAEAVNAAYRPWFENLRITQREEWVRIDAMRSRG